MFVLNALTSDLVDDQIYFTVGALAQLPDHLVVLVDLQPLQVLGCDQLQLIQNVHVGSRHQRRRAHCGDSFRGRIQRRKTVEETLRQNDSSGSS